MNQPVDPDQRLVRAAKRGSRPALGVLLGRYETSLRRTLGRMLRRPEDIEDGLQETNLRVTASLSTFREPAPFGPWIRRIATNVAISILRKRRGRTPTALVEEPESTLGEPSGGLLTREAAVRAREALALLPAAHREILELRLVRGRSHTEIAELLRVPPSSARVMFVRAMARLRKALEGLDA